MGKLKSVKRTYKQASQKWWNQMSAPDKQIRTNLWLDNRSYDSLSEDEIEFVFVSQQKAIAEEWYTNFNVNQLSDLHKRLGGWDLFNDTPSLEQQKIEVFRMYRREVGIEHDREVSICQDRINLDREILMLEQELFNSSTGTPITVIDDGQIISQKVVIDLALKISGLKAGFDRKEEEYYQTHKVELYDAVIKTASIYEKSLKIFLETKNNK